MRAASLSVIRVCSRASLRAALAVAFAALCTASTIADDGAEQTCECAWIWQLLGRLHPVIVHFPIALLLCAVVFEILPRGRQTPLKTRSGEEVDPPPRAFVREGTLGCLVFGAIGAGLAAWFGWLNAEFEGVSRSAESTVFWHRWLGLGVASTAGVAAIIAILARWRRAENLRTTYRVLMVLCAGTVGYVGHLGGTLVYGASYYDFAFARIFGESETPSGQGENTPPEGDTTEPVSPANVPPPPIEAEAVDYSRDIQPIFDARCVECHGPEKRKGRLQLDTFEEATARERVVRPGEPERSKLYRLITLPPDDEDFMPAEGDPLSEEQIDLIRRWIVSLGAAGPAQETTITPDEIPGTDPPKAPAPPEEPAAAAVGPAAPTVAAVPVEHPAVGSSAERLSPDDLARRDAAISRLREFGAIAAPLAATTDLVDVDFSLLGKSVTDDDLALLEGLEPALRWLDLGGTGVTDEGVRRLAAFRRLQRLQLQQTAVTDAGVAALKPLEALEVLNLYGTGVTDAATAALAELPALKRVYLWKTGVTREAGENLRAARAGLSVDLGVVPAPASAPAEEPPAAGDAKPKIEIAALPPCCAAAAAKGEKCDHPCCVEAAAKGEICAKCSSK